MTYNLRSVRGKAAFDTNMSVMAYLRAAMIESGANFRRRAMERLEPGYVRPEGGIELIDCFRSNDGLLVFPKEAAEIAQRIEAALPGWIAAPKRVVPKDVLLYETRGKDREVRWATAVAIDPFAPPPEAAEIGADEFLIGRTRDFIAFCRKAARQGGFRVY